MKKEISEICWRLGIGHPRYVEIESKWRVESSQAKSLLARLKESKGIEHVKRTVFFDQYLDTANLTLLKMGTSLRLRYRKNGSEVYLQYKGPGFRRQGLLYRSEFSSERLDRLVREESHHDMLQFTETSLREILHNCVDPAMAEAMRRHLGNAVIDAVDRGHFICQYQKDKFSVDLGDAHLEPSLDRICAFHINPRGPHALSTFWEYENEVKAEGGALEAKLKGLDRLRKFDAAMARRFRLKPERMDKYHRCASCFLPAAQMEKPELAISLVR